MQQGSHLDLMEKSETTDKQKLREFSTITTNAEKTSLGKKHKKWKRHTKSIPE